MQIQLITELDRNEFPTVYDALKEIVVGNEWDFFDICDFLRHSTELQRKTVADRLDNWRTEAIEKYLDWFQFVNRSEVASAYANIVEHIEQRQLWMWEMWDLEEAISYYIDEKYIQNDDEEETLSPKN
jgi:hypothetical protein